MDTSTMASVMQETDERVPCRRWEARYESSIAPRLTRYCGPENPPPIQAAETPSSAPKRTAPPHHSVKPEGRVTPWSAAEPPEEERHVLLGAHCVWCGQVSAVSVRVAPRSRDGSRTTLAGHAFRRPQASWRDVR